MIKLPEPEVIGVEEIDYGTFEVRRGYTESQMRQAIKDALEEAIDVIETANARRVIYLPDAIDLIRKLGESV